jgi:hypothetical protein
MRLPAVRLRTVLEGAAFRGAREPEVEAGKVRITTTGASGAAVFAGGAACAAPPVASNASPCAVSSSHRAHRPDEEHTTSFIISLPCWPETPLDRR